MTTFWPEVSPPPPLPLRPVMMNASLGPATRMRVMTKMTSSSASATPPPTAMRVGDDSMSCLPADCGCRWWSMRPPAAGDGRASRVTRRGRVSCASRSNGATSTRVEEVTSTTTTSVPTGIGAAAVQATLTGPVGRLEQHLAVAARGRCRDDPAERAQQAGLGLGGIGRHVGRGVDQAHGAPAEQQPGGDAGDHRGGAQRPPEGAGSEAEGAEEGDTAGTDSQPGPMSNASIASPSPSATTATSNGTVDTTPSHRKPFTAAHRTSPHGAVVPVTSASASRARAR